MTTVDKGQSSCETGGRDEYLLPVKRHVALDAVKFGPIFSPK